MVISRFSYITLYQLFEGPWNNRADAFLDYCTSTGTAPICIEGRIYSVVTGHACTTARACSGEFKTNIIVTENTFVYLFINNPF